MKRITALFIGAWAVLAWLFTCDEEMDLIEPPEHAPEVGAVNWDDCR
jgi:hypothetical protein